MPGVINRESWLFRNLDKSKARWNLLAQATDG